MRHMDINLDTASVAVEATEPVVEFVVAQPPGVEFGVPGGRGPAGPPGVQVLPASAPPPDDPDEGVLYLRLLP